MTDTELNMECEVVFEWKGEWMKSMNKKWVKR